MKGVKTVLGEESLEQRLKEKSEETWEKKKEECQKKQEDETFLSPGLTNSEITGSS